MLMTPPPAHAEYAPSSAHMWMDCTASILQIRRLRATGQIVDQTEADAEEWTAEGTIAHRIRAAALRLGLEAFDFVGQTYRIGPHSLTVDHEMADKLQFGIDWIRERGGPELVEFRTDLGHWLPGQFGTCDTAWVYDEVLFINDLKFGMGLPVTAVRNKQLMIYALGVWVHMGQPQVDFITLVIDQPRAGGLKTYSMQLTELLEFGKEVASVYQDIENGEVKFSPSVEACRFCPAKQVCGPRQEWILSFTEGAFDTVKPVFAPVDVIDPEKRWRIVQHKNVLINWVKDLERQSLRAAADGRPDPGSKLVVGPEGDRFYGDPAKAEAVLVKALGEGAYKPKELLPLTKVERLLKPGKKKAGNPEAWASLEELIQRPPGKPILVGAGDGRARIITADDFEDADEGEAPND